MNNMRALLIGGAALDAERLAARLEPGASVICFAASRSAADAVRAAITAHSRDAHVTVMLGDPSLLVYKVAGPFDVIVDAHGAGAHRRDRLVRLLRENGEIDG